MRIGVVVISLILLGGVAGMAVGQEPGAPGPGGKAGPTRPKGYLTPENTPKGSLFLPPAPKEGEDQYNDDRAVFKASRALKDTPRWKVAQEDNVLTTASLMSDFTCTMGSKISPETAPLTARLLGRVAADASSVANTAKDVFKRKRPFLIDEGETCIEKTEGLSASGDYPSGHASVGWATALVLSQLAPDRTHALFTRARAYGESRVVCGVHNVSAIDAGQTTAMAVVAALNGSAEFRADADLARAEIAAIRADRANAVEGRICGGEHGAIGTTPYPR